jgi:hypothetical protein
MNMFLCHSIYLELRRHNALEYSAQDTLKAWHYVIMSTLKSDPDVAVNGFTVIGVVGNTGNLLPDQVNF